MNDRSPAQGVHADGDLKILVVEDDVLNRKFVLSILLSAGYRADAVENGRQAVDAVREADYDLVFMDIQMPELDGIQATKQIRGLKAPRSQVRIVALTGARLATDKEECFEAGMDDYIGKPFTPDRLVNAVKEAKRLCQLRLGGMAGAAAVPG